MTWSLENVKMVVLHFFAQNKQTRHNVLINDLGAVEPGGKWILPKSD